MKSFTITLLGVLVAAAVGYYYFTATPKAPWDLDPDEAAYYKHKRFNKPPKLKRQPSNYFYEQRAYPYDRIPEGRYEAAIVAAKGKRERFLNSALSAEAPSWQPAGPTNIPGRITSIAVHPSDLNTMYAASASGGLYKSTDLGGSWTNVLGDEGEFSIGAIAVDPNDALTLRSERAHV